MIYYKMIGSYNIVHGKQKENLLYLIISVCTNIVANLIFIPIFRNNGAALASILSYGIAAFLFIRHFSQETGIKLSEMLIVNKSDIARVKAMMGNRKR